VVRRALYTAAVAVLPTLYRFSTYVGNLRVTRGYGCIPARCEAGYGPDRGASDGQLQGSPDQVAVIGGLAKELHSNESILTKLAAEIKP